MALRKETVLKYRGLLEQLGKLPLDPEAKVHPTLKHLIFEMSKKLDRLAEAAKSPMNKSEAYATARASLKEQIVDFVRTFIHPVTAAIVTRRFSMASRKYGGIITLIDELITEGKLYRAQNTMGKQYLCMKEFWDGITEEQKNKFLMTKQQYEEMKRFQASINEEVKRRQEPPPEEKDPTTWTFKEREAWTERRIVELRRQGLSENDALDKALLEAHKLKKGIPLT